MKIHYHCSKSLEVAHVYYNHDVKERLGQLAMAESEFNKKKKDKLIAFLLWIFLCPFAAQRFYIGDIGRAILIIFLGWLTFFIWPLLDIIFAIKKIDKLNEEIELEILQHVKSVA
ncbi:TM2 domain-containing protein [Kroppenstedtia eburnea]|uniref:TM2 domain-containing protein n=1 Tax=Kroppenstedtia eburnea TaxID=714067 RepID=UPI0036387B0C